MNGKESHDDDSTSPHDRRTRLKRPVQMLSNLIRKGSNARRLIAERGVFGYSASVVRRYFPNEYERVAGWFLRGGVELRYRAWRLINPKRRFVFVTFADGVHFSGDRLCKEVSELDIFDEIVDFTPSMLDAGFVERHKGHFEHARGYGFWVWKPQVILTTLQRMSDGDVLVYADAGCSVTPNSRSRFLQLFPDLLSHRDQPLLAAHPYSSFVTRQWNKADLLDHFGMLGREDVLRSEQIEAGRVGLVKCEANLKLIEAWSHIASDLHLIDDSPSTIVNDPEFIEHRHDQSIFSLLLVGKSHKTGLEEVFGATRLMSSGIARGARG